MFKTYQTKLKNDLIVLKNTSTLPVYEYFHQIAKYFGMLERKLFVDLYVRKKPSGDVKKFYCATYNITARQYNSIKKQLDGRISSKLELSKLYMKEWNEKIKSTTKRIKSKEEQKAKLQSTLLKMKGNEANFLKKVKRYRNIKRFIHQKKRKLYSMNLKLKKVESDFHHGIVRICFGSKELFQKQFHLEENGLTFQQWKKEWGEKRAAQFTFIGSKDETFGNQSCTYDLENHLRIRVFSKDEEVFGNYVTLKNVQFGYGQENIDKAKISSLGYTKGKRNPVKYYRALTWKFVRKSGHWYACVSVDVDVPPIITLKNNGVLSIDFNYGFLAVSDVDGFGNLVYSFQVPYQSTHCTSEQTKQSLSVALKAVVQYAVKKAKPIGFENLDFKRKKQNLKQMSSKQAKMLSGFAYSTYQSLLQSKCEAAGIESIAVNPAYTSQIGQHKFMKKYGISSHESAALVIGRRGLHFKRIEKIPPHHILNQKKKDSILQMDRRSQWKEIGQQWKNYSFNNKLYVLYRI
ncbi:IS200/IS605 family accessory protein TnpB-related protein [Niallia endozanthoxylica]|uniref:IS200/IS605 family element transposase accessory protein TnpB n=1 Tax=Niallia endozanthoxylica TaxID=2036016 RepID=A0A5J5I6B2_9BACI|nr:IS200/IS605 family accessory protein TnpB-related protein [Niallia endozanthoxylica]KAA9029979.1 IS200/IS605 family element transposase accessory protein TnpB [Niallia endozanthoxylica]